MFKELTQHWSSHLLARHTYNLLPNWEPQQFQRHPRSRAAETFYIRCCFTQNDTKASRLRFSTGSGSDTCTRCHSSTEDVEHILLGCPSLTNLRNNVLNTIHKTYPDINITLSNILTNPKLQLLIINYINNILTNK